MFFKKAQKTANEFLGILLSIATIYIFIFEHAVEIFLICLLIILSLLILFVYLIKEGTDIRLLIYIGIFLIIGFGAVFISGKIVQATQTEIAQEYYESANLWVWADNEVKMIPINVATSIAYALSTETETVMRSKIYKIETKTSELVDEPYLHFFSQALDGENITKVKLSSLVHIINDSNKCFGSICNFEVQIQNNHNFTVNFDLTYKVLITDTISDNITGTKLFMHKNISVKALEQDYRIPNTLKFNFKNYYSIKIDTSSENFTFLPNENMVILNETRYQKINKTNISYYYETKLEPIEVSVLPNGLKWLDNFATQSSIS